MKGVGTLLIAGISIVATLVVIGLIAPLYNEMVNIILGNTDDQLIKLMAQLILPVLVFSTVFSFLNVIGWSGRVGGQGGYSYE